MAGFITLTLFQNCSGGGSGNSASLGETVSTLISHQGPLSEPEIDRMEIDCESEASMEVNTKDRGCLQFIFGEPEPGQVGTLVDVNNFDLQDLIDLLIEKLQNLENGPEIIVVINENLSTLSLDMTEANFNIYVVFSGGSTVTIGGKLVPHSAHQGFLLQGGKLSSSP